MPHALRSWGITRIENRRAFDSGISPRPDLHAILITGFASKDLLQESDRGDVLQLREKPFDLDEVRRAVQNASQAEKIPGRQTPRAAFELRLVLWADGLLLPVWP
jgi:DNA-binding NtrC family response regulator